MRILQMVDVYKRQRFDFTKALAGRALKDGEFSFVLKDANGTVLQTKRCV